MTSSFHGGKTPVYPARFLRKPIAVITGEHDTDHRRHVDDRITEWLLQIGAKAEAIHLSDHGLPGNGHMMMLEWNSGLIADLIATWISRALQ